MASCQGRGSSTRRRCSRSCRHRSSFSSSSSSSRAGMATAGSTTRAASGCEGGVATATATGITIITTAAPRRHGGAYSRGSAGG